MEGHIFEDTSIGRREVFASLRQYFWIGASIVVISSIVVVATLPIARGGWFVMLVILICFCGGAASVASVASVVRSVGVSEEGIRFMFCANEDRTFRWDEILRVTVRRSIGRGSVCVFVLKNGEMVKVGPQLDDKGGFVRLIGGHLNVPLEVARWAGLGQNT